MKKKLLITITVVLAILVVGVFVGCTESLKQDAIATNFSDAVASNGGMAVVYGDYLYFVNGYAGVDADNAFGEVVKGAVARVALENGLPKGEAQIIVPKNVYGTDKNYGGIYISDHYIYYATTSTELDGNGNPKTGKCVLMRTKVDGTDTKEIATFDDHSIVFKVVGDKLVYIRANGIYSVDLKSKKFDVTTVDTEILTGYLMDDTNVYYTKYIDGDSANYSVNVYPLAGGEIKTLLSANIMGEENTKYKINLTSVLDEGNTTRIFYHKEDNGQGTPKAGFYSLSFDKNTCEYVAENEARFTLNASSASNLNYTKFYKAGDFYLGFASTKIDAFKADGTRVENPKGIETLNVGSTFTVFDVEETENSVYLWYFDGSNVLHKIQILAKNDGNWAFVEGNETKLFSEKYDSSYVSIEKIGNVLYYLGSDVSNNAFYYVLSDENPSEGKGKILGEITEADVVAAF